MNLYKLPEAEILLFVLVLMRLTAFVLSAAVISSFNISPQVKILLSISLAVVMFPIIKNTVGDFSHISENIISLTARELIVGLSIGFLTRMFFYVISMVGEMVSISMGLASAQLFNPLMGNQGNVIEQFFSVIATILFFAVGGHHILITGIFESFKYINPIELKLNMQAYGSLPEIIQSIFVLVFKMCSPVLITILITNISLGILGRAVPQINVLITSMPITILLGLVILIICMPLYIIEMNGILELTAERMMLMIKTI